MKTGAAVAFEAKKRLEIVEMDGNIQTDPIITHTLTLAEINRDYDLMHAGESIRGMAVSCPV